MEEPEAVAARTPSSRLDMAMRHAQTLLSDDHVVEKPNVGNDPTGVPSKWDAPFRSPTASLLVRHNSCHPFFGLQAGDISRNRARPC
jgi:hypothetical protein